MSSQQFAPVACPLCLHPEMWSGTLRCPGCLGGKKISQTKRAVLFAQYPELARCDTEREFPAVTPEEQKP